jgi:hypothetical protein
VDLWGIFAFGEQETPVQLSLFSISVFNLCFVENTDGEDIYDFTCLN